ncbi:uncharacterized protein LOC141731767 isoform X2 [Zonotrichia albicollis]|uniref:uncharacterized protein LOC141731767 isoform X2 n=1 Tax=Zonotrichia albicollis TaxID=44394 RepID=UPI003D80BB0F
MRSRLGAAPPRRAGSAQPSLSAARSRRPTGTRPRRLPRAPAAGLSQARHSAPRLPCPSLPVPAVPAAPPAALRAAPLPARGGSGCAHTCPRPLPHSPAALYVLPPSQGVGGTGPGGAARRPHVSADAAAPPRGRRGNGVCGASQRQRPRREAEPRAGGGAGRPRGATAAALTNRRRGAPAGAAHWPGRDAPRCGRGGPALPGAGVAGNSRGGRGAAALPGPRSGRAIAGRCRPGPADKGGWLGSPAESGPGCPRTDLGKGRGTRSGCPLGGAGALGDTGTCLEAAPPRCCPQVVL